MNTLQDLLNTICSLKVAADHFQSDVENLKEKFDKASNLVGLQLSGRRTCFACRRPQV